MSAALYEKYTNKESAGYTWDWGDARSGSWAPHEGETSLNRYVIDFRAREHQNIDNNRRRSVRLVWVAAQSVNPKWTTVAVLLQSIHNRLSERVACDSYSYTNADKNVSILLHWSLRVYIEVPPLCRYALWWLLVITSIYFAVAAAVAKLKL